jgi:hypothetical protein
MASPSKRAVRRVPAPPRRDLDERDIDELDENGDDESPRPSKRAAGPRTAATRPQIKGGVTEAQRVMDSTSSFAQAFKPEEKSQIIKFLEPVPYAAFRRHWVDHQTKEGKQTRAYTCLLTPGVGDECPMCEVGDRPQAVAAYNIAIISEDGTPIRKSWDVGARAFNVLKSYSNDPKIAPLTRGFFLVSKTGKKGGSQINISPVRASALEEDYDTPIPDQAELDKLERYGPDIVEIPTMRKMREVAAEVAEEYD